MDSIAIISAIEAASRDAHVATLMLAKSLSDHTANDDARFAAVTKLVESIALDVKSLLETRTFTKGAARTVVIIASFVSAAVSAVVVWIRGH